MMAQKSRVDVFLMFEKRKSISYIYNNSKLQVFDYRKILIFIVSFKNQKLLFCHLQS